MSEFDIGTHRKKWSNYDGIETVNASTYISPSSKFYHQVEPLTNELWKHTYNPFQGNYKGVRTEYMVNYCTDDMRSLLPPIEKYAKQEGASKGGESSTASDSSQTGETHSSSSISAESKHPHTPTYCPSVSLLRQDALPNQNIETAPLPQNSQPSTVMHNKYAVLEEYDRRARHPSNWQDESFKHERRMDAWKDNITALFQGNQGYVPHSTYSLTFSDPWELKMSMGTSRYRKYF